MGKITSIEWTHHTFNPWWGCEKVSPGCAHCYAEAFAKRTGHAVWGADSPRRGFGEAHWEEPRRWAAAAERAAERRRVFCASMADVFEDRGDLLADRHRLWGLMADTTSLDWLLLTKRPENVRRMVPLAWLHRWPTHVWLGTTAEDSERAQQRVRELRGLPAPVRFLSCEPLLEDLGELDLAGIAWVIVGGESGGGARPFRLEWARALRARCEAAGTAFFMKQAGARVVDGRGRRVLFAHRKGGNLAELPEDLRVRELPNQEARA